MRSTLFECDSCASSSTNAHTFSLIRIVSDGGRTETAVDLCGVCNGKLYQALPGLIGVAARKGSQEWQSHKDFKP